MKTERRFRNRTKTQRRMAGALLAYFAGLLTVAGGGYVFLGAFLALAGITVAAW